MTRTSTADRARAAALARHYRDSEHLPIGEIARRLGRSPATVSGYLYDPDGQKVRRAKERYRGVCVDCGGATWGAGPGLARERCAQCNGRASARWDKPTIEAALRAWQSQYGREANSTDLSITHARAAAARDGGVRLRRLEAGWPGGSFPSASVVQYHYGTVRRANRAALAAATQPS